MIDEVCGTDDKLVNGNDNKHRDAYKQEII